MAAFAAASACRRSAASVEVPSIEPAKDGYVGITHGHRSAVARLRRDGGVPAVHRRFAQLRFQIGRWDYRDLIREQIGPWMAERTVDEIVELGQLFRLPIAALGNGSTIRGHGVRDGAWGVRRNPAGFHQPRPPWLMSSCAPGAAAPHRLCRRGQ